MSSNADTMTKRNLTEQESITAEDVAKAMDKINRSKRSARQFLQSVGVSFSKNGGIRIRSI